MPEAEYRCRSKPHNRRRLPPTVLFSAEQKEEGILESDQEGPRQTGRGLLCEFYDQSSHTADHACAALDQGVGHR